MQAEHTTLTTNVLGAPVDWRQGRDGICVGLPVVETRSGFASYWRPSPEQLAALNAGALVQLHVWGRAHPPVSLDVEAVRVSKIIEAEAV